jgi:hypothetical protein
MTLHARLELALAIECRRIRNRSTARIDIAFFDRVDVGLPRSMATLTIDALRQRLSEGRTIAVIPHCPTRVAVMTRHAVFIDKAAEIHVRGTVVARTHRPITAALGVPADRHFQKPAVGGAVKERPRVIAGADEVIGS